MRAIGITAILAFGVLGVPASQSVPQDAGAAGAWQKIQKVRTTASVLHGTAHPDDEHGGVLATLSRRDGARVMLMTLTRGESGDNAIGPQLFDALGLIRTDELLTADKYYGVDEQYFTTMIDYGFSKRLDETTEKWGLDNAFRDVVRMLRMSRPWVVLSRFQGNARDGHGNHQAAGLLSQQAAEAAGDPTTFPEQIAEGLRPWAPFKVYMGGVRANEHWTVRIDSGEYSPWLGDSYANIARFGLSFQRSQNSGRYTPGAGPNHGYYMRTASRVTAPVKETSIFDGIDTTYAGLFKQLGRRRLRAWTTLAAIDAAVAKAASAFTFRDPSAAVPALADGLRLTREVIAKSAGEADALFVLQIKERQFQDAINAALGVELTAPRAESRPTRGRRRPRRRPLGRRRRCRRRCRVRRSALSCARGPRRAADRSDRTLHRAGRPGGRSRRLPRRLGRAAPAARTRSSSRRTGASSVSLAADASQHEAVLRPGVHDSRYTLADPASFGRP